MSRIIKPLGALIAVTTADNVNTASLVRIHANVGAATVTLKDSDTNVIGSFSMTANAVEYVTKNPTDTIECSAACNCTSVAFS